jgi:hypothetical protein
MSYKKLKLVNMIQKLRLKDKILMLCLTNYNVVVDVPAVAVVPSIIDNRVALRRELRVRGASYLLMCHELEGEHSTVRKKL